MSNNDNDEHAPIFKGSSGSNIKDDPINESDENSDSVMTFGEDLDVPAFIRNRQE